MSDDKNTPENPDTSTPEPIVDIVRPVVDTSEPIIKGSLDDKDMIKL